MVTLSEPLNDPVCTIETLEADLAAIEPPAPASARIVTGSGSKETVDPPSVPEVRALGELRSPAPDGDPQELIGHRFLCRGAVCLLVGATGIGKSSFLMQLAIHFAVGKPLFGLEPGRDYREMGMRILLVQAENDDGDLGEMRDGVLAGCTSLTDLDKAEAGQRIKVCRINDQSSDAFIRTLDALLTEHGPFDLVIIDPALAYVGGDSNTQKDVGRFMRELLNPLLHRHQVGLIMAHHTNKPLRVKEKEPEAGDHAYSGAGSAEWINSARAALAIRSTGSDTVFELRAIKRGKRLRWCDADGAPTVARHIAHNRDDQGICWRDADPAEVDGLSRKKTGRGPSCELITVLEFIGTHPNEAQGFYTDRLSQQLGCGGQTVQRAIQSAEKMGFIKSTKEGRKCLYNLTATGRSRVTTRQAS